MNGAFRWSDDDVADAVIQVALDGLHGQQEQGVEGSELLDLGVGVGGAVGMASALTARGIPPTGTEMYGGPIVTAGGLVFVAATVGQDTITIDRIDPATNRVVKRIRIVGAPAASSQSTNLYASAPRSPTPKRPGSEVGWRRSPAERRSRRTVMRRDSTRLMFPALRSLNDQLTFGVGNVNPFPD